MRNAFTEFCCEQAKIDKHLHVLTADLGYGIFDSFRQEFQDRFINVGVAEQNLIGIGTGMALTGLRPICYSIGNFPTLRCLEQIRNDAAYHDAQVTIVSSGGGFGYGQLGMSHHATEDVGVMSSLPNVSIYSPATPFEAKMMLNHVYDADGVKYVRLEKTGEDYELTNSNPLKDGYFQYSGGSDGLILCLGTTLSEGVHAMRILRNLGINVAVCSLAFVKSHNKHYENLLSLISAHRRVTTIEEHNKFGGIGSMVSNLVTDNCLNIKLTKIAMNDTYSSVVGDQKYLRNYYGINANAIIDTFK